MTWFRRLAEVADVPYDGSPHVDPGGLPGHDRRPRVETYELADGTHSYIRWPDPEGEGSISPASRHAHKVEGSDLSDEALLRRLEEALELPGEPRDYHFAMVAYHEEAYKRRRDNPGLLRDLERFCIADIRLVEAYPGAAQNAADEFYRIPSYSRLAVLYEREGFLREALDVAERGLAHGQDLKRKVGELRARVDALEAENADGGSG